MSSECLEVILLGNSVLNIMYKKAPISLKIDGNIKLVFNFSNYQYFLKFITDVYFCNDSVTYANMKL